MVNAASILTFFILQLDRLAEEDSPGRLPSSLDTLSIASTHAQTLGNSDPGS